MGNSNLTLKFNDNKKKSDQYLECLEKTRKGLGRLKLIIEQGSSLWQVKLFGVS